jgi:adenylosuccinate synthase
VNADAIIVVDLGFGDAGKGVLTDYLVRARESDLVVRFNGGPQAGHNVVLPDGRHHTFSQWGSGTFLPRVRTLLSRFMLIEPYALLNEARHLASIGICEAYDRLLIDGRCRVITPAHVIANRIRERARGRAAHGTCGMGVGECVAHSLVRPDETLHAAELTEGSAVRRKCRATIDAMRESLGPAIEQATDDERRVLEDETWIAAAEEVYAQVGSRARIVDEVEAGRSIVLACKPVFEGAQGVLLDEVAGFAPHTTWSRTTRHNADELLHECGFAGSSTCVGVTRTYATRHGAGPLVSEDRSLDESLPEPHNASDGAQGKFRRGVIDFVMLRYASRACKGVDALAVTHLDRLPVLPARAVKAYQLPDGSVTRQITADTTCLGRVQPIFDAFGTDEAAFIQQLQQSIDVPVRFVSRGPTGRDVTTW